jgi:hypothetical protein
MEQPIQRLFFAITATLGMSSFFTDCTNAYANAPLPNIPTFVCIDDAYANWYHKKYGIKLDCTMVLQALHALQNLGLYGKLA